MPLLWAASFLFAAGLALTAFSGIGRPLLRSWKERVAAVLYPSPSEPDRPMPTPVPMEDHGPAQPSAYHDNAEFWAAARTDGQTGDGSQRNPFDAGNPDRLQALMSAHPENTTWHFAAGTYAIYGKYDYLLNTAGKGVQVFGAGIDQTIFKVTAWEGHPPNSRYLGVAFGGQLDYDSSGFQLFDCTIDVNGGVMGGGGAVCLQGSHVLLERCKFIHFGTTEVGSECFVTYSFGNVVWNGKTFDDIRFDRCVYTEPMDGNKDGITVSTIFWARGDQGSATNAQITNCQFLGISGHGFTYSHAFAAQECFGNFVDGCDTGTYAEPLQFEQAPSYVHDNHYKNVHEGVHMTFHNTGKEAPFRFEHNRVELTGNHGAAVSFSGDPGNQNKPALMAVTVLNNQITGPSGQSGIRVTNDHVTVGDLTIADNTIDLPDRGSEIVVNKNLVLGTLSVQGNRRSDGSLLDVHQP